MLLWKKNLLFVWLSQFFSIMGFSLCLPFSPYYIQKLGVVDPSAIKFWAAFATSATALGLAIGAPIWGVLADRYGRKLMMLRANFSAVVVLSSMGFAPSVGVFAILRFVQGILTGTVNAAMTFVSVSTPQNKQGMALGLLSAGNFAGALAGPFIGGFLVEAIGYRPAFAVSGFLLLISSLLVLFFVQESFIRPLEEEPVEGISFKERIEGLGPGAPILALLMFMSLALNFDGPILPLYVQEILGRLQGASRWTGALNGVSAIGAMLAGLILGRLVDRVSPPFIGKFSALGAGLFMAGTGLIPYFSSLFPMRLFLSFCGSGLDPTFQVWLSRVTPSPRRGRIFGWAVSAKAIGWMIGPLIGGFAAMHFGFRATFVMGLPLLWLLIPLIGWTSRKVLELDKNGKALPGS